METKFDVKDDDACDTRKCSSCGRPSLRYKPTEGTLACMEPDCGIVESCRNIDPTNESRNFAPENRNGDAL